MDTRKLLEELENVINNASDVPFTNKKMVDKDEVERLIDAINQSLPNELESARRIVADKERIMLDAEKKAEDNIAQAKDYIARITEESELVKQSQERANEIITLPINRLKNCVPAPSPMLPMYSSMWKPIWKTCWTA